ncbi:MAG: hypothetical protein V4591_06185 [Bdellovibrionota bacterium]
MSTILEFIAQKNSFRHHAILLLSNYFSSNSFSESDFKLIVQEFCDINLFENKEDNLFVVANAHPDIFIADRERNILRLEDIKKIRNFSLYPPQQGKKRLFLIENCERLNANAANSLLKVLEEPPTACLFLLTSHKLSLVLPTIASRVQKVSLSFPQSTTSTIKEIFSAEDMLWIKNKIDSFSLQKAGAKKSAISIGEIITQCEKMAKEYEVEDLRACLVTLIGERVKQDVSFLSTAKLLLSNVSEWKNYENYHPSTFLWLVRLFLLL